MYISVTLLIIAFFTYFICATKNIKNHIKTLWAEFKAKRELKEDKDCCGFNAYFETIRKDIWSLCPQELLFVNKRIDEALVYTVPDGKKFRGLLLVKVYKNFVLEEEINQENLTICYALGWLMEILQAGLLIYDDIMDESVTRRGKLCWYKYNNNAILAINDGSFFRAIIYKVCEKYCSKHKYYREMLDVAKTVSNYTTFGQILDCLTTPSNKRPDFTLLTERRYETIVKCKTSLYTFILPVRTAMYLANINDNEIHTDIEKILLRVGHLFQVQDDYLDIYGDPRITGKIGTDIEDGKCSWIAVKAYEKMNTKQKQLFQQSYGWRDPVSVGIVRGIFDELKMKNVFIEFEDREFNQITKMIDEFENRFKKNFEMLRNALNLIYRRPK